MMLKSLGLVLSVMMAVLAQCPSGPFALSTVLNGQTYYYRYTPRTGNTRPATLVPSNDGATAFTLLPNGTAIAQNGQQAAIVFTLGYLVLEDTSYLYNPTQVGYEFVTTFACDATQGVTITYYQVNPATLVPENPQRLNLYACTRNGLNEPQAGGALVLSTDGRGASTALCTPLARLQAVAIAAAPSSSSTTSGTVPSSTSITNGVSSVAPSSVAGLYSNSTGNANTGGAMTSIINPGSTGSSISIKVAIVVSVVISIFVSVNDGATVTVTSFNTYTSTVQYTVGASIIVGGATTFVPSLVNAPATAVYATVTLTNVVAPGSTSTATSPAVSIVQANAAATAGAAGAATTGAAGAATAGAVGAATPAAGTSLPIISAVPVSGSMAEKVSGSLAAILLPLSLLLF